MLDCSDTAAPPGIPFELARKYNVPGPRYTSYPTAVQFSEQASREALLSDAVGDLSGEGELSVYIHLPFCETLCWYCACNTITTRDHGQVALYLDLLRREIALWRSRLARRPRVGQLHFGGGTPSFLRPQEIGALGAMLHDAFDFTATAEVSVEIDPRRLTAEHVAAFRRIGANRASLGVQDFAQEAQRAINRVQSLEATADALRWIREAGFASVNFDLIYGLPMQTVGTFQRTLDEVIRLAPDRLAVFSYAHVPWLRPAQKIFERTGTLPSPEEKLALLQIGIERLTRAGYAYIGMDHFALPGDELAAAQRARRLRRNFQGYSTKAGLSILGLGLSSISQTPGAFRQNEKTLEGYLACINAGELPFTKGLLLQREDRIRQEIIMRIMCDREVDYAVLGARLGVDIPEHFREEIARLQPLAEDGFVELSAGGLRILPMGCFFRRNIAMVFDAYLASGAEHHSRTV
ncbi:MAG: oxygen-independent coproporphyrinogen III oxidase [Puniceicoccales bacterium]|jgi:oxygen-independent coproporphyrinogen-3 oxidase|nr:oxygen-independent coproporphyrinogen III oxidase [Puniceicoccales bacterium]